MPGSREWIDPRDGCTWVADVTASNEGRASGRQVITFRGDGRTFVAQFSSALQLEDATDDELTQLLDQASGGAETAKDGRLVRRDASGPIIVEVREAVDCEPIDIDAWVERWVRTVLELEGVLPEQTPADPPFG